MASSRVRPDSSSPVPGSRAASRDPEYSSVRPIMPSWAEWLVRFLDDGVRVPGTEFRFGADALLGLVVPVAGDAVTGLSSVLIFVWAVRSGVSRRVLWSMAGNIVLDTLIGAIPLVGDLFDLGFKANRRNLRLVQAALAEPVESERAGGALVWVWVIALVSLCVLVPVLVFAGLFSWLWSAAR